MSSSSPPPTTITPTAATATTSACSPFSQLPPDILRSHILPTLDGCTLTSVGCTTPELRSLSSDQQLWSHVCHSTWPSTTSPRLHQLITSSFPGGPRSFFSLSFPRSFPSISTTPSPNPHPLFSEQLISAVDIFYRGKCIFSKVVETETLSGWFRCAPFRVDLVGPKESVPTPIRRPRNEDDTCLDLYADLELSWIVVDPTNGKAVNVSSLRPVSVERHWLNGEVHVKYATVLGEGHVMCSVEVMCEGSGGFVLHVIEACLKVENIDGVHLNGRDSLVILESMLEGKKGNWLKKGRVEEGRMRYYEYLERKRDKRERMLKREARLDNMCVGIGVFLFVGILYIICFVSR